MYTPFRFSGLCDQPHRGSVASSRKYYRTVQPATMLLAECNQIIMILQSRTFAGEKFLLPLSPEELAAFTQCLKGGVTWATILCTSTSGFEGGLTVLELASQTEVVQALGWYPLTALLEQLVAAGDISLQLSDVASVLLHRLLVTLLRNLDPRPSHTAAALTDNSSSLVKCITTLYVAMQGDRCGDLLLAPHLLPDLAESKKKRGRFVRVAQWLVLEKRWRALHVCLKTLTDASKLPGVMACLPVLRSSHVLKALDINPDIVSIMSFCCGEGQVHFRVGWNVVPQGPHVTKCPRMHLYEHAWEYWHANTDETELCAAVRTMPIETLRAVSPGSGNALIHFAAQKGWNRLVCELVQRDASQAMLQSNAIPAVLPPALLTKLRSRRRRRMRTAAHSVAGKLPLQLVIEFAATADRTLLPNDLELLLEATCVKQCIKTSPSSLEGLMEAAVARGDLAILRHIVSNVSPEEHPEVFTSAAVLAARTKHPEVLFSVIFDAEVFKGCPPLLSHVVAPSHGPRCALAIAAISGNTTALERICQIFSMSAAAQPLDNAVAKQCGACVEEVFHTYWLSDPHASAPDERERKKTLCQCLRLVLQLLHPKVFTETFQSELQFNLLRLRCSLPLSESALLLSASATEGGFLRHGGLQHVESYLSRITHHVHTIIRNSRNDDDGAATVVDLFVDEFVEASARLPNQATLRRDFLNILVKRAVGKLPCSACLGWIKHLDALVPSEEVVASSYSEATKRFYSMLHSPRLASCLAVFQRDPPAWQHVLLARLDKLPTIYSDVFQFLRTPFSVEENWEKQSRMEWFLAASLIGEGGAATDAQRDALVDLTLRLNDGASLCPELLFILGCSNEHARANSPFEQLAASLLRIVCRCDACPAHPRQLSAFQCLLTAVTEPYALGDRLFYELSTVTPVQKFVLPVLQYVHCGTSLQVCTGVGKRHSQLAALCAYWPEAVEVVVDAVTLNLEKRCICTQQEESTPLQFKRLCELMKFLLVATTASSPQSPPPPSAVKRLMAAVSALVPPYLDCIAEHSAVKWPVQHFYAKTFESYDLCALAVATYWKSTDDTAASTIPNWLPKFVDAAVSHQPVTYPTECIRNTFFLKLWTSILGWGNGPMHLIETSKLVELLRVAPLNAGQDVLDATTSAFVHRCRSFDAQRRVPLELLRLLPDTLKGLILAKPSRPEGHEKSIREKDPHLIAWGMYLRMPGQCEQRPLPLECAVNVKRAIMEAVSWLSNTSSPAAHQRYINFLHAMFDSLPSTLTTCFVSSVISSVFLFESVHVIEVALQWATGAEGKRLTFDVSAVEQEVENHLAENQPRNYYADDHLRLTPALVERHLRILEGRHLLLQKFGLADSGVARGTLANRRAFWCAMSLGLFCNVRVCGRQRAIIGKPYILTNDNDPCFQILSRSQTLAGVLVDSVTWDGRWLSVDERDERDFSLRMVATGNELLCRCVWSPYFSTTLVLPKWTTCFQEFAQAKCTLGLLVAKTLLQESERQRPPCASSSRLLQELAFMRHSDSEAGGSFAQIFEDATGVRDPSFVADDAICSRLSAAQLLLLRSPGCESLDHSAILQDHLKTQSPDGWSVSVETDWSGDPADPYLGPEAFCAMVSLLSIPVEVTNTLESCTTAWKRWHRIDPTRLRELLLQQMAPSSGPNEGGVLSLLNFFSTASVGRMTGNLHVMLNRGSDPWSLRVDDRSECRGLILRMSVEAPLVGTNACEGFSGPPALLGANEHVVAPHIVLTPFTTSEFDAARIVNRMTYMDLVFGANSPRQPSALAVLHLTKRPVDELIRDMFDAGLPEITLGLLQVMLSRHHSKRYTSDSPAPTAVELLSRQSSAAVDEDDLQCCVCMASSLLDQPVMLSCFHLLCESCVRRLSSMQQQKCPLCNAWTMKAPKILVTLPVVKEEPMTHSVDSATAAGDAKHHDTYAGAPSVIASLCRQVIGDLEAMGLSVPLVAPPLRHPRDDRNDESPVVVRIVLSGDMLRNPVVRHYVVAVLRNQIWSVARLVIFNRDKSPFIEGVRILELKASTADCLRASNCCAILNYIVGPQTPLAPLLTNPAPIPPWCVQQWTWVGSTAPSRPQFSEDAVRSMGSHFGALQQPISTLSSNIDAETRQDYLQW